jgi:hypothetical protein
MNVDTLDKIGVGLPVVIIFGDDYQLPAMGKPGATSIPIIYTKNTQLHHDMTQTKEPFSSLT